MKSKQVIGLSLAIVMVATLFAPAVEAAGTNGGIDLNATIKEPKPEIGINVDVDQIAFGELLPGESSASYPVAVTNVGLRPFDATVSVEDDGTEAIFEQGITVNDGAWDEYSSVLVSDASDSFNVALQIPETVQARGDISGSLIVWAEEHSDVLVPMADFSALPLSGDVPLTVQFTDLSSNSPTSWSWTFGDGATSSEQSPVHEYTAAGTYTVSLTVSNDAGSDTMTKGALITVNGVTLAPSADFVTSITPLTVQLTDQSVGATSWSWSFGDGTTSTERNPTHAYPYPATYTVSLTATNSAGSSTATKSVYVMGPYSAGGTDLNSEVPDAGILAIVNGSVNPVFTAWASQVVNYSQSAQGASYANPAQALGPAGNLNTAVVSLGDLDQTMIDAGNAPGSITLGFVDVSIYNGPGPDFAAFENGFGSGSGIFAELGYVEVSTNGVTYVRFPSVSLTPGLVGAYGTIDPTGVYNLVGKHLLGVGTPFDLSDLVNAPEVLSGAVDLNNINYVRIVDIPGNGYFKDSLGNPIYDAWLTHGSGGLDLDALGVLNGSPKLVSEFSADITFGNAPLEVQFTDESLNSPTSWEWQFGDGATSDEQNPSHTYGEVGAYTVTLTVYNATTSAVEVKTNMINVIDSIPSGYLLNSSTYLGGSGEDTMSTSSSGAGDGYSTVAVASDGTIYVIGSTTSTDLPVTSGAYNATNSGGGDAFIARYSSDMSTLLALTYLGGSGIDKPLGIAIAGDGSVYVTGYTASGGLSTGEAYQTANGGGNDVFVAKFDASLSSLMAFTYLGGAGNDQGYSITIGIDGIYVTGSTSSDNLATQGAHRTVRGGTDAFVAKFDASLSHLLTFTYLGGTAADVAFGIAIGNDGTVYVTGRTGSSGLATTEGYQKTVGGSGDAFVARLNAELSTLMAFTYLGGEATVPEAGSDIAIAGDGSVYVTGYLGSSGLATPGAYDTTFDGLATLSTNAFVAKFDANLGTLQALTYFGGTGFDRGQNIVVTDDQVIVNVLIRSSGNSVATTANAFSDVVSMNGNDAYLACFDLPLSSLIYGSYFGGTGNDNSYGMALTSDGSVITAGFTNSTDLPMRNAVDDSYNGGNDLFLTRWVPG